MKCPECGKAVIAEGMGEGVKTLKCHSCGWVSVRDRGDRSLLTEIIPTDKSHDQAPVKQLLNE